MDEKGFRSFLKAGQRVPKNLDEGVVRSNIEFAKRFEQFLAESRTGRTVKDATARDARRFVKNLAKSKENSFDNLLGLLRYARFANNQELELDILVTLDGGDVLDKLLQATKQKVGKKAYDEMFSGYRPPPIGTPPSKMPGFTQEFMARLQKGTDRATSRAVLLTGVHAGPPEAYVEERELRQASKDVDEYLAKRRQKMIDILDAHRRNGTLFFTQEIDDLCMEFVRGNPEVAGGVRKGRHIYQTKIPYMMKEYLREGDPKMRRYYACHCPLARETILTGEEMPRDLCYCSAGYEKMPYEVAFGMPVKATVLKSVLWGDQVCRFKMEIPEEFRVKASRRKKPGRGRIKPRGK